METLLKNKQGNPLYMVISCMPIVFGNLKTERKKLTCTLDAPNIMHYTILQITGRNQRI